ncbi:hypothetical protein P7L53_01055 [Thermoleptolyngbya sichuanensis XZ-Cy5]|uniref:hypothetical protein n=1 Tax=Thermoleptolyngbya sichuanensis TaxID=2885951 RepID=UPI00240DED76|nr:hypothetical protein [Thermoleptolyngbya sichuanensis]MDG2614821.1 hypothetical protein [Thermoleptolyngbya sichuanensis XZ-Cy5]
MRRSLPVLLGFTLGFPLIPMLIAGCAPSLAGASIPIDQVVSQLRSQTSIPIFLPDAVPGMEEVYVHAYGNEDGYGVLFDYVADCKGATACNYGSISAERYEGTMTLAEMLGISETDTVETVALTNGVSGQYANTCGAYCVATVVWQADGILYGVSIKNGEKEATIALANGAIAAGPR